MRESLNEELDNERRLEMGRTQVKRRLDKERGVVEKLLRKIGELKNERLHNKEMTDEMKRDARRKEANLNKELAVTQAKVKEIEENLKKELEMEQGAHKEDLLKLKAITQKKDEIETHLNDELSNNAALQDELERLKKMMADKEAKNTKIHQDDRDEIARSEEQLKKSDIMLNDIRDKHKKQLEEEEAMHNKAQLAMEQRKKELESKLEEEKKREAELNNNLKRLRKDIDDGKKREDDLVNQRNEVEGLLEDKESENTDLKEQLKRLLESNEKGNKSSQERDAEIKRLQARIVQSDKEMDAVKARLSKQLQDEKIAHKADADKAQEEQKSLQKKLREEDARWKLLNEGFKSNWKIWIKKKKRKDGYWI